MVAMMVRMLRTVFSVVYSLVNLLNYNSLVTLFSIIFGTYYIVIVVGTTFDYISYILHELNLYYFNQGHRGMSG